MFTNLVSLFTKSLSANSVTPTKSTQISNNPFSSSQRQNPFLSTSFGASEYYGKNQPVAGGYFAGYYNGKPNIVGRKLFIEV